MIAISRFTRERLIDVYGLPAERVHYVPPGVGAQWHAPGDAAAEAALDSYRLPACFILCVGSANRRKNLARVIEAVARLRQAGLPTLELLICGPPGGADRAVRRATDAAGGAEWVRWLGYVSDDVLRALYARAAAVVYVSLYEGFGLPVLEALACGGVVVASSTTAVSEAAGDACIRVDPEDVEQVADGIRAAVEDESLRGALRGRAAAHLAGFDWDATAAATVDVYRAALDRR